MSNHESPRSLDRGLSLLRLLAASPGGLGFNEVGRRMKLPSATVARLLGALTDLRWLAKDPETGRYRPGPELTALQGGEDLDSRLRRIARPHLERLRDAARNTVLLIRWDGKRSVCLERVLHPDSLVLQEPGYVTKGLFEAPWGIFCLAGAQWRRAISRKPAPPGATWARYRAECARLAAHGYCVGPQGDRQRLAAPLRREGLVVGALAVGGTLGALNDARVREIGALLATAARACECEW